MLAIGELNVGVQFSEIYPIGQLVHQSLFLYLYTLENVDSQGYFPDDNRSGAFLIGN